MVKLKDGIESIDVDGQHLIVDPTSHRCLLANKTGYEMLAALAIGLSEKEAAVRLAASFDTTTDAVLSDFRQFSAVLVELGLATYL